MIPIPGTAYLLAAAFIAGAFTTYKVMDWKQDAEELRAVKISRELERGGVVIANKADKEYIAKLTAQKEKADARAEKFKAAMEISAKALSKCAVRPELVSLLNEPREGNAAAGITVKPKPTTPQVEASSNCALVLETYHWNIDNVIEPNRLQVEGLQKFYNDVRQKFNAR